MVDCGKPTGKCLLWIASSLCYLSRLRNGHYAHNPAGAFSRESVTRQQVSGVPRTRLTNPAQRQVAEDGDLCGSLGFKAG